MTRSPVAGWKAGLVILGALLALFSLFNWLGNRYTPQPTRPQPTPTIVR